MTFILRNTKGENLRFVECTEELYEDALVAFETDRAVTIVTTETGGAANAELISITSASEISGNSGTK